MQQPRLDGPTYASSSLLSLLLVSSRPYRPFLPLSAPLAQIMALPYVSDVNRTPLVRTKLCHRGSALFLHSSIPEIPWSLRSFKLPRISMRIRKRTKFFFFVITFSLVRKDILDIRCCFAKEFRRFETVEAGLRGCWRSEITELWNSKWKSVGQWSVTVEIGRVCN